MKRNTLVFSLIGICVLIIILCILHIRPPRPEEWDNVAIGIERAEVLKLYPDIHTMKEIKGFDVYSVKNSSPYLTDGYWQMQIYYSESNTVSSITYKYIDRNCGILNKTIVRE